MSPFPARGPYIAGPVSGGCYIICLRPDLESPWIFHSSDVYLYLFCLLFVFIVCILFVVVYYLWFYLDLNSKKMKKQFQIMQQVVISAKSL